MFWESLTFSWVTFLIGLILILTGIIRKKKSYNKPIISYRIGIGVTYFILIIQIFLFIIFKTSKALIIAEQSLSKDSELTNSIGEIESFSLLPIGQIKTKKNVDGESGQATLTLIAKGKSKFKILRVSLIKNMDSDWEVVGIK